MSARRLIVPLLLVLLAACAPAAVVTPAAPPTATEQGAEMVAAPVAPSGCRVLDGRADARCTPGVRNPQVTQANIATTVCRKGWTATVRPPVSYTDRLKRAQMLRYGEPGPPSLYEEDHLISLELGGSPTEEGNLFPEPYAGPRGAKTKDLRENALNRAVCNGRMKLTDAQAAIVTEWTHP